MSSNKFYCIVSGLPKKISKQSLDKKLLKYGSLEVFTKYYVDRAVKNMLKKHYSIDQIRQHFNTPFNYPKPDLEILYKLKLLKTRKSKKNLSEDEKKELEAKTAENERNYFELKEKISSCRQSYVEWATGNNTCIRPDIYYDYEHNKEGRCKPCPYHEYCLCRNKQVYV